MGRFRCSRRGKHHDRGEKLQLRRTHMAIYHVIRGIAAAAVLQTIAAAASATTAEEPVRPFRSVQKIFTQSCAFTTCHSAVSRKGNLILEHEDLSYAALVDKPSDHPDAKAAGLLRVV